MKTEDRKPRQLLPGYKLHGKRLLPQFRFLIFLLTYPQKEFSVSDFVRESGMNKMTVYRYLAQAEHLHLIERSGDSGVRSKFYPRKEKSRRWGNKHSSGVSTSIVGGEMHHERIYRKTFKLVHETFHESFASELIKEGAKDGPVSGR